jgi:hypothetical protein
VKAEPVVVWHGICSPLFGDPLCGAMAIHNPWGDTSMSIFRSFSSFVLSLMGGWIAVAAVTALLTLSGCEQKERIIDVETPGKDVEVDRDVNSGRIEVEVKDR